MQLQLLSAGGKLVVNLFGDRWVVLTGTLWVESTEERPPQPPCGPAQCRSIRLDTNVPPEKTEWGGQLLGCDSIVQRVWDLKKKQRLMMSILSPPNLDLTRLKCWLLKPTTRLVHRRWHRRHGQLFRETLTDALQYTYTHTRAFVNRTSKEQMHGYGTCATE